MRIILLALLLFVSFVAVGAQVPIATQVQILKAEDARRFDSGLEGLMRSPNAAVRVRAALAAGRIGDAAAVPGLIRMLADPSEKVREMAAFALGETESIEAADAISIALGETARAQMPGQEKANVRGRLVEAAGKIVAANIQAEIRAVAGVPEKNKALNDAILFSLERELQTKTDPNKETILLALTAALRARPLNAEEAVRKFLAYTDPDIVATALNTLLRLRAKNANRDARDLLETHTHAVVRANAARLLGAAEDKEAVDLLIKAATRDVDSRVRVSAIRSLAALKDQKAAEPLLARGEQLLAAYSKAMKPNFIPDEQSEFVEIATALGRILQFTRNERAINLIREFGKLDKGMTAEVYVARVRINPRRGDGNAPELTHWQQYRTMALIAGEVASLEMPDDESKAFKAGGLEPMRMWAEAVAEINPATEGKRMLANPDILQAYAKYKTDDLGKILRTALGSQDIYVRTTAAQLISELPSPPPLAERPSEMVPPSENLIALKTAYKYSVENDITSNDAILAILEALSKIDPSFRNWGDVLLSALQSPDHLVREKAQDLIPNNRLITDMMPESFKRLARKGGSLQAYSGKGTKIGQLLNSNSDYRRALSRKNGSISAALATEKGSFTIEFLPEEAPLTVDNFVKLARVGYFNGLEVHRVVPNFVMQDGDPRGDGNGGPGWSIRCEINMVPFERGAVGMALSGKDTGGSQWFVTHSPQPHLDGGYTVFGRVNSKGMEVVDKIVRGDRIISVKIIGSR